MSTLLYVVAFAGLVVIMWIIVKNKKPLLPAQESIPQELLIDDYEKFHLVRELGMSEEESQLWMTKDFRDKIGWGGFFERMAIYENSRRQEEENRIRFYFDHITQMIEISNGRKSLRLSSEEYQRLLEDGDNFSDYLSSEFQESNHIFKK